MRKEKRRQEEEKRIPKEMDVDGRLGRSQGLIPPIMLAFGNNLANERDVTRQNLLTI